MKTPKKQKLFNLEQWISQEEMVDGVIKKTQRLVATLLYNVPYAMCEALRGKSMNTRQLPGTYYKIPENNPQSKTLEVVS